MQTHRLTGERFIKYALEIAAIQKLIGRIHSHRQHGDCISLLSSRKQK
jgi:hypothetical protein